MIEWFNKLSTNQKIGVAAITVPALLTIVGGIFAFFLRKDSPPTTDNSVHLEGTDNSLVVTDDNKGYVAGRDIILGIDVDTALDKLIGVSKEFGKSEEENERLRERVSQLEAELAKPQMVLDQVGQETPQPTAEAKELAKLITENDGPYAEALKAIAEGNREQADAQLDDAQQILDRVEEEKNLAQVKIYMARIENATYAGQHKDALQWGLKLEPIAGDDPLVLNKLGAVFYENAVYKKAEPLMKRALAIDEASFGKEHPRVAIGLNNLAVLYQATNRLTEAVPLMERALTIDEENFGKDHPTVAIRSNNLAELYRATNRLAKAEPLMERALAIDEASFGKEHPKVATRLNNLAMLYHATNRLAKAEPLLERALAIDETSFGKDHPTVAIRLHNLARLYQDTNRLSEAEPLMKRALTIDKVSFGEEHPRVAIGLNNLAQLYQDTKRLAEAEPLMERALAIDEASFGKDHPTVAIRLNNLARLYKATNRFNEAEQLFERALEINEASLGKEHPDTVWVQRNLDNLRAEMQ